MLPLFPRHLAHQTVYADAQHCLDRTAFMGAAQALAQRLPSQTHCLNLCDDRLFFMLGFCAALLRGLTPAMAVFSESFWPLAPAEWARAAIKTIVTRTDRKRQGSPGCAAGPSARPRRLQTTPACDTLHATKDSEGKLYDQLACAIRRASGRPPPGARPCQAERHASRHREGKPARPARRRAGADAAPGRAGSSRPTGSTPIPITWRPPP